MRRRGALGSGASSRASVRIKSHPKTPCGPVHCPTPMHHSYSHAHALQHTVRNGLRATAWAQLRQPAPNSILVCALPMTESRDNGRPPRHGVTPEYGRVSCHCNPCQWCVGAWSVWLRVCCEPPSVTGNPWPLQFFTPMCRQPSQTYHSPPFSHSICLRASFSSIPCHALFISSRLPTDTNPTTEKQFQLRHSKSELRSNEKKMQRRKDAVFAEKSQSPHPKRPPDEMEPVRERRSHPLL